MGTKPQQRGRLKERFAAGTHAPCAWLHQGMTLPGLRARAARQAVPQCPELCSCYLYGERGYPLTGLQ